MAKEVQKELKDAGNMPEKSFSAGAVNAAVWLNKVKDRDGNDIEVRSVTIQRRYKDGDDWKSTNTLRLNDIPKMVLVLQKAYDYLLSGDTPN